MQLFLKTVAATVCATVLASTWMLGASDLSSRWNSDDVGLAALSGDRPDELFCEIARLIDRDEESETQPQRSNVCPRQTDRAFVLS